MDRKQEEEGKEEKKGDEGNLLSTANFSSSCDLSVGAC